MKQIILASSSPRRKDLLQMIGLDFETRPADIDETLLENESAEKAVLRLAVKKADTAAENVSGCIVIGSDTLVEAQLDCRNKTIFGKPRDKDDAYSMLKILSGQKNTVYTGIAVLDADSGKIETGFSTTEVYMKTLDEKTIRNYIETGEPLDKAGAYAIQGKGAVLIEKVSGDFFNGVGISVSLLYDLLKRFQIDIF
ncbi:MAG: Maf family protein [Spirochaetia bacterium]|nr:Maf family protein [Spirochaetia bacterium]